MGAGERLGVVVVSFYEQKLEACPAEQSTDGAEEAAPFLVARQVAEVAEAKQRVAALLDRALDQATQVVTVGVKVAEDEQTAHLPEPTSYAPGTTRARRARRAACRFPTSVAPTSCAPGPAAR